jgi:hypothetical protein
MSAGRQCEQTRPDGQRCQARAVQGQPWCFFHSPDRQARQEAGRRGGSRPKKKAIPQLAEPLPLECVRDVAALVAQTINTLRQTPLTAREANAIGYLASVLLRALEASELAQEIGVLKQQMAEVLERNGRSHINPRGRAAEAGPDGALLLPDAAAGASASGSGPRPA